jgi:hypothetical protein
LDGPPGYFAPFRTQREAAFADRVQMGAAGNDRDFRCAGCDHAGSRVAANGARSVNADFHAPSFP